MQLKYIMFLCLQKVDFNKKNLFCIFLFQALHEFRLYKFEIPHNKIMILVV